MKYTLLDMTQTILSSMSSDEVNSISDSPESLQVANIIRQKYYDIINRVPLPEHEQLIQLDPSLDIDSPVLMFVPQGVTSISWLKYFDNDTTADSDNGNDHDINLDLEPAPPATFPPPGYQYVNILSVRDFIETVNALNPEEDNVESWTFTDNIQGYPGTYTLYYRNDRTPSSCCIINNYYVLFDSYDAEVDSTLQSSKTMAWGRIIPTFQMVDSFIPSLTDEQFQLLINESKALAFFELKQQPHQLAIQETKRGWSNIQKNKAVANRPTYFDQLPNFGRNNLSGYGAASSYFKLRGFDK